MKILTVDGRNPAPRFGSKSGVGLNDANPAPRHVLPMLRSRGAGMIQVILKNSRPTSLVQDFFHQPNEVSQFLSFVFRRRHRVILGIVLYRHLHACTCIIMYVHVRKQPCDRDFFMYSNTRIMLRDCCMILVCWLCWHTAVAERVVRRQHSCPYTFGTPDFRTPFPM
jgi:hypothetical protein